MTIALGEKGKAISRYIDAEYCEDFFDRWESRVKNAEPVTIDVVQNTRTLLRDAPSIDIVRCKECKHFKKTIAYCVANGGATFGQTLSKMTDIAHTENARRVSE